MVKNAGLSGFNEDATTRDVEDPTIESVDVLLPPEHAPKD